MGGLKRRRLAGCVSARFPGEELARISSAKASGNLWDEKYRVVRRAQGGVRCHLLSRGKTGSKIGIRGVLTHSACFRRLSPSGPIFSTMPDAEEDCVCRRGVGQEDVRARGVPRGSSASGYFRTGSAGCFGSDEAIPRACQGLFAPAAEMPMRRLYRRHFVSVIGSKAAARAIAVGRGRELEAEVDDFGPSDVPEVRVWSVVGYLHTSLCGFGDNLTKRRTQIFGRNIRSDLGLWNLHSKRNLLLRIVSGCP